VTQAGFSSDAALGTRASLGVGSVNTRPRPTSYQSRASDALGGDQSGAFSSEGYDMRGIGKAALNETKHPYVIELEVASDGLDVILSRRIVQFHESRHVQPQYGRTTVRQGGLICRWCFDDLSIARDFVKQFNGHLCKAV
jgi:hypothetical protein